MLIIILAAYWFTYPENGIGREWYVAVGDINGNEVEMHILQTENGILDQQTQVSSAVIGSATTLSPNKH